MIPTFVKEELLNDPLFRERKCCLHSELCEGRIEWHHAVSYGNGKKRIQERWAIVQLCHAHHLLAELPEIKDQIDWIVVNRMTVDDQFKYNKIDWEQKRRYLEGKFKKHATPGFIFPHGYENHAPKIKDMEDLKKLEDFKPAKFRYRNK